MTVKCTGGATALMVNSDSEPQSELCPIERLPLVGYCLFVTITMIVSCCCCCVYVTTNDDDDDDDDDYDDTSRLFSIRTLS